LCCGIPVAGFTGVGGNDWLIKKGVNGYLSARTPEDFATAIIKASQLKIDQDEINHLREIFSPATIDHILLNALSNGAFSSQKARQPFSTKI
jgi:glycosyltransferase involved in cell wall biosynthesis